LLDDQSALAMENRTVKEASVEGVQRRTHPKKHFVSLTSTQCVDDYFLLEKWLVFT